MSLKEMLVKNGVEKSDAKEKVLSGLRDGVMAIHGGIKSLEPEDVVEIAKELAVNKSVIKLKLAKNAIGEEGGNALGEALEKNDTLRDLELKRCDLRGGVDGIARGLLINRCLKRLDLSENTVYDASCVLIADALKVNDCLETLLMKSNYISNEGAIALGMMLKENESLTDLNLERNNVSEEGMRGIAEGLRVNMNRGRGLEYLGIGMYDRDELKGLVRSDGKVLREWSKERHWRYGFVTRVEIKTVVMMWSHDEYEEGECEGIRWNELPWEVVERVIRWLANLHQ